MQKSKKIGAKKLFFMLVVVLVVSVISITVLAEAKSTPTRTELLDVSKLTETTDMLDTEGWKWEPTADGGRLTLKDCYIQGRNGALCLPFGDVTIKLEGENTVETNKNTFGPTIYSAGPDADAEINITIVAGTDDGKLKILRKDASATANIPYGFGGDSITIKSGSIYTNMGFCIIESRFAMQGGFLKIDTPNVTDTDGIYTIKGNVDISGGTLDIDTGRVGIWMPGNTGEGERKVNITGGDVKIRSGFGGIYAKNITINTDGNLDLQGKKFAMRAFQKGETGAVLEILAAGSLILDGADHYLPVATDANTTVTIREANYTKVNAAITKADSLNPDNYVSDLTKVKAAIDAVVTGKKVLEQNIVNGYATAIEEAINQLVKKPAQSLNDPSSGIRLEYEDGTLIDGNIELSILPQSEADMERYKDKVTKAAAGYVLGGLYEIKLLKSGVPIQPSGRMRIRIPLTETTKYMAEQKIIYIDNHGAVTLIPSKIEYGMIVYVIDHFSYYGVIGKPGSKNIPKTGDNTPILLLALMMVASAGVIAVVSRKKRMTH